MTNEKLGAPYRLHCVFLMFVAGAFYFGARVQVDAGDEAAMRGTEKVSESVYIGSRGMEESRYPAVDPEIDPARVEPPQEIPRERWVAQVETQIGQERARRAEGVEPPTAVVEGERKPVPGIRYEVGQAVEALWQSSWYKARILSREGDDRYKIHYVGYEASFDEVVGAVRLRPMPVAGGDVFAMGVSVEVLWKGQWYSARVIGIEGGGYYRIHYDGYSNSWDEVVGPDRIRCAKSGGGDVVQDPDVATRIVWASGAGASTQYGDDQWSANQVKGEPDTTGCGDFPTAWASKTPDGRAEWLLVSYEEVVIAKGVRIHETFNPGAVSKIEGLIGGVWTTLWEGKDPNASCPGYAEILFPMALPLQMIRVHLDAPGTPGWNEIDAVGLLR